MPGDCPSSMATLSTSCAVPNVSQDMTWTVAQFSNQAGTGAGNTNQSASYAYNAGGFENCPSDAITTSTWYPHPSQSPGWDPDVGVFTRNGQVMSIQMTVPANARGTKEGFLGAVYGGLKTVTWAVSKTACDVDHGIVDVVHSDFARNKIRYLRSQTSSNIDFSYSQGAGPEGVAGGVSMVAGQTYYLNIRMDDCNGIDQGCYYWGSRLP
ncbi:MAG: hypothetical protein AMXMBFR34_30670 [Myxococcaceae bacterium]